MARRKSQARPPSPPTPEATSEQQPAPDDETETQSAALAVVDKEQDQTNEVMKLVLRGPDRGLVGEALANYRFDGSDDSERTKRLRDVATVVNGDVEVIIELQ